MKGVRENIIALSTKGIEAGIIAVVIVIPFFIFPLFSSGAVFEFAKQILFYFLVGILIVLWALKFLLEGRIQILRTSIDVPIIFFVLFYIVSVFFSVHRPTSVLGPYPQLQGGLISLFSFIVFYILVVSNISRREQFLRIVKALAASTLLVAVLALLGFFKAHIGVVSFLHAYARPVGSWDMTAYWLTPFVPLFLGLFFFAEKMKVFRWVVAFVVLLLFITVIFIDILILNVILFGALFLFLFLIHTEKIRHGVVWLAALILVGGVLFMFNIDELKNDIPYWKDLGITHDIRMKPTFAWFITSSAFPDPKLLLLGSGPGTFSFDFVRFKPLVYNYTAFWNIRFNESSSELFQMISTNGILSSLAYMFITVITLVVLGSRELWRKMREEKFIFLGLGLALFVHVLLQVTRPLNSAQALSFWLFLGLIWGGLHVWGGKRFVKPLRISLTAITIPKNLIGGETLERKEILPLVFFLLVVILVGSVFFFETKYLFAEIQYRNTRNPEGAPDFLVRAAARSVLLMPHNEFYRMNRSQLNLRVARSLAVNPSLTEEDRGSIVDLLRSARTEADIAYIMNPYNVLTSENRGNVYTTLASFSSEPSLVDESINSYRRARQLNQLTLLDFYNPRYPYLIGLLELNFKNNREAAVENFRIAINLKNDYAPAHYMLAKAYEASGRIEEAIERLDAVISLYDPSRIESGRGIDIFQLQDLGGRRREDIEAERERLKSSLGNPVPSEESLPGE